MKKYKRSAFLYVATLIIIISLPLHAVAADISFAHKAPLIAIDVLAQANADRTTTIRVSGQVAPDTTLPATVSLIVPLDFIIQDVWGYVGETAEQGDTVAYSAQEIEGGIEISATISEGIGVGAEFLVDGEIYDPTAMGGSAMIASLEFMAPNDLQQLSIGFVTPQDYVGTGTGVVTFGEDTQGNAVVGMIFENVASGEVSLAQVAFVTRAEYEEAMSEVADSNEEDTTTTSWSTMENLLIPGLILATLALLALLFYFLRKQR